MFWPIRFWSVALLVARQEELEIGLVNASRLRHLDLYVERHEATV